jgi:hypothetical protein
LAALRRVLGWVGCRVRGCVARALGALGAVQARVWVGWVW